MFKRLMSSREIKRLHEAVKNGDAEAQYNWGIKLSEGKETTKDLKKATKYFELSANQGYSKALFEFGFCLKYGVGIPKNILRANKIFKLIDKKVIEEFYNLATKKGDVRSQYNLGICYQDGIGVIKNPSKAFEFFKLVSDQGSARGQNILGAYFENGIGVSPNILMAVTLYTKAAKQGYPASESNLGRCYEYGIGVHPNLSKAVSLYKKAASQGYTIALVNLGDCFKHGTGVSKNIKKAAELYQKAAEQGDAQAQNNIGNCFKLGLGVKRNISKAVEFYELAAAQGYADAQYNLGLCCETGKGINKNLLRAFELYKLASEQKHMDAQNRLGLCYQKGIGTDKNISKAIKIFHKLAIEQEYSEGQNSLGFCYQKGIGVVLNLKRAVELYKLAAAQGNIKAKCNLGNCYEYGIGVTKDIKKAANIFNDVAYKQKEAYVQNKLGIYYMQRKGSFKSSSLALAFKYFNEAAAQEFAAGQCNLGHCYEHGIGCKTNIRKAIKLYELAAEQEHAGAQYRLGNCFMFGKGVTKDFNKGVELCVLAAKQGHKEALSRLHGLSIDIDVEKEKETKNPLGNSSQNNIPNIPELPLSSPPKLPTSKNIGQITTVDKEISKQAEIITEKKQQKLISSKSLTSFHIPYESINLGKKLGEGGFGDVYSGEWQYNKVAIKLLKSKNLSAKSLREMEKEAQIMAKMKSDYIVTLRGICIKKPPYAIVMELMPKGSLDRLLHSKQEIPWQVRYNIGSDVGFGLQQLHENNIIHQDLKSLNVLLTDNFRAKICDFGLSNAKKQINSQSHYTTANKSTKGNVAGTMLWQAPELFKRGAKHTKESDTYSYGMVLWELSSREFPYASEECQNSIPHFIATYQHEDIPEDCPKEFKKVIESCWKKPSARLKPLTIARQLLAMAEQGKKIVAESKTFINTAIVSSGGYAVNARSITSGYQNYSMNSNYISMKNKDDIKQIGNTEPKGSPKAKAGFL